jgi:nitrogen fixation protein NifU and related proteins
MSDLELYHENILDYYKNPRNKCSIEHTNAARELNPLCGDELTIYLNLVEGIVTKASFEGEGCAISQAAISMLTEKLVGMNVEDMEKLGKEEIFGLLGIPISYTREKCALLSLKVLHKSLEVPQC